ncbi:MAG TPA: hypothetical protein VK674_03055 [Candidatus Limnocylindria bacterium]|nr:hypothetical protein [Candidatus Limnocylindria bacterium]
MAFGRHETALFPLDQENPALVEEIKALDTASATYNADLRTLTGHLPGYLGAASALLAEVHIVAPSAAARRLEVSPREFFNWRKTVSHNFPDEIATVQTGKRPTPVWLDTQIETYREDSQTTKPTTVDPSWAPRVLADLSLMSSTSTVRSP